ncbi:MAG TPA: HNH endonuclease family protein [Bacteroidota bacterium]|nr:HNH endonuclease family protein [Bacteroidota bacterium]
MQYAMFLVMKQVRGKTPNELAETLAERLHEEESFSVNERFSMHKMNRYMIHRLLARMTDFVERESGLPSRYTEYVGNGKVRYEVEHIWADHFEQHQDEFSHPADFAEYRNRIGGLLLLPKSFNASYGDLPYEEKREHYLKQDLLAQSLHPKCYERNPGFLRFIESSGLPFKSYEHFKKAELDERQRLLTQLAEQTWSVKRLYSMAGKSR